MPDTLHTVESTGLPRAAGPLRYANERPGERVVNTDAEKRAELLHYLQGYLGEDSYGDGGWDARIHHAIATSGGLDEALEHFRSQYSTEANSKENQLDMRLPGAPPPYYGQSLRDERPEPGLEHIPAAHDATQLREVRKRSNRPGKPRRYAGERPGERVVTSPEEVRAELIRYAEALHGPLSPAQIQRLIITYKTPELALRAYRGYVSQSSNSKEGNLRGFATAGIAPDPTPEPELEPYDTGHGHTTMRRKQASRRGRPRRLAALPQPVRVQGRQVHSTEEFGQEFGRLGNTHQPDFLHDPTDEPHYQAVVKHLLLSHPHLVRPFTNSLPDSTLLLHAFRDHFRGGVTPENAHEFGEMLPSMVRVQPRRPANVGPSSNSVTALRGTRVDTPRRKPLR